jgi:WD40 repeat protein
MMNRYFTSYSIEAFRKATKTEASDPEESLAFYTKLRKANRKLYLDLLAVSILCPVAASLLAYYSSSILALNRAVLALVFLGVLGYSPAIIIYGLREHASTLRPSGEYWEQRRGHRRESWSSFILTFLVYTFLGNIFLLSLVAIFAALVAAPFMYLLSVILETDVISLPRYVALPILALAFVYSLGFWFSRSKPPLLPVREHLWGVFTDLKLSGETILQLLFVVAVNAVLVGSGPLGLLYERPYESVLASGISGLLLGLVLARPETDAYFGRLVRLCEARCLLRLNRKHEARYRLNEVMEGGDGDCPEDIRDLADVIAALENPRKHSGTAKAAAKTLERLLDDAENHDLWLRDSPEKVHRDIWLLSVLATCALSHPEILANRPGHSDVEMLVPAYPGMQLRHTLRGHWGAILAIAWSPDGALLASGAVDETVRLWNTESGECLRTLRKHRKPVRRLAWSQDGRTLVSHPFIETRWMQLANSFRILIESITDVFKFFLRTFLPGVVRIVPISQAASVRLWDVAEGKTAKNSIVRVRNPLTFSWMDGSLLYVSAFWDAGKNQHVQVRKCEEDEFHELDCYPYPSFEEVSCAVFSPDGRLLAACSAYGPILVWEMKSGALLGEFTPFGGTRDSLAWSPDEKLLAIGTFGAIHILDVSNGSVIKTLEGNQSGILHLVFSPDGRFLAYQSFAEKLCLFRCDTWKTVASLIEPTGGYRRNGLAFHPSRPWIATRTDRDRAIRIWELDVETLLARAESQSAR